MPPQTIRVSVRVNYAIVMVSEMSRSVAFYRDVLGIPMKFESPYWTEFATEGATLVLHPGEGSASHGSEAAEQPPGSCRPGLQVPSVDAFHQRMLEHHVKCVEPPRSVFGARVAQYLDPDGLPFSVGEPREP